MSKSIPQVAAFALAAVMTLATVAGMNGIASTQYAKADSLAMASSDQTQAAAQHVAAQHVASAHLVVLGHRFNA